MLEKLFEFGYKLAVRRDMALRFRQFETLRCVSSIRDMALRFRHPSVWLQARWRHDLVLGGRRLGGSGQQLERRDVSGTDHREVSSVEWGQLGHAKPFSYRDDRGADRAQGHITVLTD
jgi:hypothetical protein